MRKSALKTEQSLCTRGVVFFSHSLNFNRVLNENGSSEKPPQHTVVTALTRSIAWYPTMSEEVSDRGLQRIRDFTLNVSVPNLERPRDVSAAGAAACGAACSRARSSAAGSSFVVSMSALTVPARLHVRQYACPGRIVMVL